MPDTEAVPDERTLIQQASRDPAAFQALYERYVRRIYAYAAAQMATEQDAEDIVSGVFLQVVRGLAQFRNRHELSFAAWIFTLTRNMIADAHRRSRRQITEVDLDTADVAPLDETPELDQHIIRQEDAARLRDLLDRLPERRRETLVLRYFSGLRNQEIAQVLGLDERTIAAHISRGLRDLQAAYLNSHTEMTQEPR